MKGISFQVTSSMNKISNTFKIITYSLILFLRLKFLMLDFKSRFSNTLTIFTSARNNCFKAKGSVMISALENEGQ